VCLPWQQPGLLCHRWARGAGRGGLRGGAPPAQVRISKWLKDLETMFYGSSLAYDKALQGGRGLGEALLRNVYGGDAARGADAEALARYVRRELDCLALTESADVMTGQLRFSAARLARPAAAPPAARPAGLGAAEQRGVGPDAEAQFAG